MLQTIYKKRLCKKKIKIIRRIKIGTYTHYYFTNFTDDQWLAAFLRGCKHRIEQSKAKIDLYYSLRSTAPYLYNVKHFEPRFMDIINLG